jgi:hypothetical protein
MCAIVARHIRPIFVAKQRAVLTALCLCCLSVSCGKQPAEEAGTARFAFKATALAIKNFTSPNDDKLPADHPSANCAGVANSWRLALLPFTEAIPGLDWRADWCSEKQRRFRDIAPPVYCIGGSRRPNVVSVRPGGPQAVLEARQKVASDVDSQIILIESYRAKGTWIEAGDLTGQVVRKSLPKSDALGTMEVELEFDDTESVDALLALSESGRKAFCVMFADLAVWELRSTIPWPTLRKYVDPGSTEPRNRDEELRPYMIWEYSVP